MFQIAIVLTVWSFLQFFHSRKSLVCGAKPESSKSSNSGGSSSSSHHKHRPKRYDEDGPSEQVYYVDQIASDSEISPWTSNRIIAKTTGKFGNCDLKKYQWFLAYDSRTVEGLDAILCCNCFQSFRKILMQVFNSAIQIMIEQPNEAIRICTLHLRRNYDWEIILKKNSVFSLHKVRWVHSPNIENACATSIIDGMLGCH